VVVLTEGFLAAATVGMEVLGAACVLTAGGW